MKKVFDFIATSTNVADVALNVQHCAAIISANVIQNRQLSDSGKLEFLTLLRSLRDNYFNGTSLETFTLQHVPESVLNSVQSAANSYVEKVLNAPISNADKNEFTNLLIAEFENFKKTYSTENSNPYKTFEDFTPPHLVKFVRESGLLNEAKEATRERFIEFTPPEVLAKLDSYGIKY